MTDLQFLNFALAMTSIPSQGSAVQRFHDTISGPAERAILRYLSQRAPNWITSDGLTGLGVLGALITCLAYWLAEIDIDFMWLAIAGLALNWLGDSLDGTLARHRKVERPQYGFFLDHTADTFAMALIAFGIGLSPKTHLLYALAVLAAYYLMVILSMATCLATGVFRVSFGGVGPTEIRLVIALCSLSAIFVPAPSLVICTMPLTIYDLILIGVTAALVLAAITQTIRTARSLAKIDPPRN